MHFTHTVMKKFLFAALLALALQSSAQDGQYIHKHLFRSMLTISPALTMSGSGTDIFLHGNIEYYIDSAISVRGDGFFSIRSADGFNVNHSLFSGASYHFHTNSHFDPYIGIEPGVAMIQSTYRDSSLTLDAPDLVDSMRVDPLFSTYVGFNLYAQKYFHLFVEARYVAGKHFATQGAPVSLNEIRFSFGLGWNIL